MRNLNYNNKPDVPQPDDELKTLTESLRKFSIDFTSEIQQLAQSINNLPTANFTWEHAKIQAEIQKLVSSVIKKLSELNKQNSWEDIRKAILQSLSVIEVEQFQPKEKDKTNVEIDFSEQQLDTIENLNININVYTDIEKSTKTKKFFTKDTIIALLGLLMAIVSFVQQSVSNDAQQQTALLEEQNKELKEISENAEELIVLLQDKLNTATSDEADLKS